jgi:hypothetical protein
MVVKLLISELVHMSEYIIIKLINFWNSNHGLRLGELHAISRQFQQVVI